MKFLVIVPAHNEENYIRFTLDSVISQHHLPHKLIVVNDGSTDGTEKIVRKYCKNFTWMELKNTDAREKRESGSKVVRSFNFGLKDEILTSFDVIVKLDADLSLPDHYFKRIAQLFSNDSSIGIAGGICLVRKNGQWIYENVSNDDHVRGPIKSYRKDCFNDIGGLRECQGWDAIDEYIARMKGWTIFVDRELKVRHHRKTNEASNWTQINIKNGESFYLMRYGIILSIFSCFKRGIKHRPYIFSGVFSLIGYLKGVAMGKSFKVSKKEGTFIKKYRYQYLFNSIKKLFSK